MLAKGTKLYVESSPSVFTPAIGGIEIVVPERTWDTEETTGHDSEIPVKTARPTVRDDGSLKITLNGFDPENTEHALLRTLASSGDEANFKITYPSNSLGSFTFSGFVTNFTIASPVNGLVKITFTIKANGTLSDQAASITTVAVTDAQGGAYVTDEFIQLTATFNEIVRVTGTPRIPVVVHVTTRFAAYVSGSGTNALVFRYTFVSGDAATATQLSVSSPAQLNSGTIRDMGGNAATLTFTPPVTSTSTVN